MPAAIRSSLYPETVFHLTDKDGLYGILADDFRISYSEERIEAGGLSAPFIYKAPMVSFSDLKLSELRTHISNYGSYGIGLSKAWATREGLSPVVYVNRKSTFASEYIDSLTEFFQELEKISDLKAYKNFRKSYMAMMNMLRYMKNYKGTLERKNGDKLYDFRFADEREWRFVPDMNVVPMSFVPRDENGSFIDTRGFADHEPLRFTPEDVRYLVVESDDQRESLINHIENVKSSRTDIQRKLLASKIITADQIHLDA